jgi:hypothetical protein
MMGITSPALLLGLLLATAYAAAFHLWGGRNVRDLLVYWLAACAGFAVGHIMGELTQIPILQIGRLHIVEGTLGALAALIVVRAWSQGAYQSRSHS